MLGVGTNASRVAVVRLTPVPQISGLEERRKSLYSEVSALQTQRLGFESDLGQATQELAQITSETELATRDLQAHRERQATIQQRVQQELADVCSDYVWALPIVSPSLTTQCHTD